MNLVDVTITDIQQIDIRLNTTAGPTMLHVKPIENDSKTQLHFETHETEQRDVAGYVISKLVDNRKLVVSADDMTMWVDPIEDHSVNLELRDKVPNE